jgi:hypothetical protein
MFVKTLFGLVAGLESEDNENAGNPVIPIHN